MIQSFAVGETTPEEAHKIGMELAGAVLGGKYEFVLTTHVDKDHLHNHFTRTKTLGAAYTEEAIKERIKGVYVAKTKTLREDKKIRLVVDLENSIKAQQSAGYERWAKIHNLKQAAKSMNFLTENKIEYYSELESKIADIMTARPRGLRWR